MARRFERKVPKTPIFKKNMYIIPERYSEFYEKKEISDPDEQKAVFYNTQFGGFRLKRIPSYLEGKDKFFSKWFKIKNEEGFIKFKSNEKFISEFGHIKLEPLLREQYTAKEYSNEFLAENGFSREEANEIESFLEELNEFYSSFRLNIDVPNSGTTCEDKIDLARFNSIPHLQYRPMAGGRLHQSGPGGSYQRISSSLRPSITINGGETSEIDLTAATIQFLHITFNKLFGANKIMQEKYLNSDPYQYFLSIINSPLFKEKHDVSEDLTRDDLKQILYTLIYSKPNYQKGNVNRRLKKMNLNYFHSNLKWEFYYFFKLIADTKEIPLDEENNYPAHLIIFKEESRFAREVLNRGCLKEKFPVFPIHDSFITTKNNNQRLENILCDVSNEFYGYTLPYKNKF